MGGAAQPGDHEGVKRRSRPLSDRFWPKVGGDTPIECWPWLASLNDGGYGQINFKGRPHRAHRIAYEFLVGPIPEGLVLDHLCRNRRCVNPWHLEPVTDEENIRRGRRDSPPRPPGPKCKNGHKYTAENTRIDSEGYRRCRTCERRDSLAGYYRRSRFAKLERANCTHCSKDVAIHKHSRQFAHHMIGIEGCLFGCCGANDTCPGTLRLADEAARRLDDRSGLREWKRS
ncbi:HNH endonuclease signature motif containing protein [Acinetobacter baumannii]|uniref:HNH nuclease domain-containing protein n=1 Tax=Acinetobacter baumannii TaxID=470 RepID=A0AAJ0VL58_ACIBA|nr:hypothetical protein LV35_04244 [Acinetobacter baumannii]